MTSVKEKISIAILARLDLVTELKYKAFDIIRLKSSDFSDWELPAVQLIDLQETSQHAQRKARKSWNLVMEVIVGPTGTSLPSQPDLWNLMQTIEQTLWAEPQLGLIEVIQMTLLGSSTDLHLMAPFYLGRIELLVDYYQPLVGDC